MGPGESYMGISLEICTAGQLMVKDLECGLGRIFKGTVDDITLHHYGACDTYQMFGDAVCITAPVTVVIVSNIASTVHFNCVMAKCN